MSVFIQCDPKVAKGSVEKLLELFKEAEIECSSSLKSHDAKTFQKFSHVVVFLTQGIDKNPHFSRVLPNVLMKKKKLCVVFEAEKGEGAVFSKDDLQRASFKALVKNAKPAVRKVMDKVSAIPFRKNDSFARFAFKRILHVLQIEALPETSFLLPPFEEKEEEVRKSVLDLFEGLNTKEAKKARVTFVGFQSSFSEDQFFRNFKKNIEKGELFHCSHLFDETNSPSCSAKVALEAISSEMSQKLPKFVKGSVLPTFSVESTFKTLLKKPSKGDFKLPKGKKAFLFFRWLDSCDKVEVLSLIQLLQSVDLGQFFKIYVTGSASFVEKSVLESKEVLALFEEEKGQKEEDLVKLESSFEKDDKCLLLLSLFQSPIPTSFLSKVCEVKETEFVKVFLSKEVEFAKIKSVSFLNFFKSKNVECSSEVLKQVSDSFESVFEAEEESVPKEEFSFAFREFINLTLLQENYELLLEKLKDFNWFQKRVGVGVFSFMKDLKKVHETLKEKEESVVKWSDELFSFLQQSHGVLFRDKRELSSQLLARFEKNEENKEFLENAVSFAESSSEKVLLPVSPSLKSDSIVVNKLTFDFEVTENPFKNKTFMKTITLESGEKSVVCGNDSGEITLFSANTFNFSQLKSFSFHDRKITSISQFEDLILSSSADSSSVLFNSATGKHIFTFNSCNQPLLFSGIRRVKGELTVFEVSESFLKIWKEGEKWKVEKSFDLERALTGVVVEEGEFVLALGFVDGSIKRLDYDFNLKEEDCSKGHTRGVLSLATSEGVLVSGGFDRKVCVWRSAEKLELISKVKAFSAVVSKISVFSNRFLVTTSVESSKIKVWNLEDMKEPLSEVECDVFGVNSFAIIDSEEEKATLVVSGSDYNLQIVTTESGNLRKRRHGDRISCVAVSGCSSEVATGSVDGSIFVWDSVSGELLRELVCEAYAGHLFVFSVDGKFLLSRVGAWSAETGLRERYIEIAKENRNPLKKEFLFEKVGGYMNTVELKKEVFSTDEEKKEIERDGVCFSTDSAEQMLRVLLPATEHRKEQVAVCCSGNSVHFLRVT